ncbi:MAG: hypothetical protein GX230_02535 [Lentisphaerae bacterium]|nr:hypothetical protein [Lentisphaerota bacterium]
MKLRYTLPALILALLSGCSSYRLAAPVQEKYRDLAIPVLKSTVTQAEAEAVLTHSLRREAISSGEFNIVTKDKASLIMEGVVISYSAKPVRYLRRTSGIPAEYRVTMSAKINLIEADSEAVVVPEFTCEAETTAVVRDDLPTAKAAVLSQVATRLARTILLETSIRLDK